MGLKTIKEFCHKDNLGEGLVFDGSVFKLNIDKELETIATALTDLNENKANKTDIATVYKIKGTTTVNGVNSINAEVGDVYNLSDSGTITLGIGGSVEVEAGDNVVYTENGWDKLSASAKITLEAGDNISVEGNVINAEGYIYDKYNKSITFGSKYNEATNYLALALGDGTTASGEKAHAEGGQTIASGTLAHAEGSNTRAKGDFSHTEGKYTKANNEAEHALGVYNVSNTGTDADNRTTLYSIGVGTSSENKNAHEVMNNGDTFIIGIGNYNGTNPYEAQTLQEVLNTVEYSLDFKEDLTTIQEINISNTWKLNQIIGYNISSINLSIEGQETQTLTLTDNNWVSESLTTILIYPTNRIVWEIIKADETLPAILGISKIKL